MKGFFLTVLALLLSIAFVRFVYGLQANESSYFVQVILNLPPDIKSDFSVVIEAFSRISDAFSKLGDVIVSGGNIFDVIKTFFRSIASVFSLPFAFSQFLLLVLKDIIKALRSLFELLFGEAVVPIKP